MRVKLQIWATAGEERFRSVTQMYYKNASAIVLVYDQTSESSFDSLEGWIADIEKYKTEEMQLLVIASSKIDMISE
jgi:GTPase SAR1 family protein